MALLWHRGSKLSFIIYFMSDAVSEHKVATILELMRDGKTPAEVAAVFRKQAEIINACSDALVREKQAVIGTLTGAAATWAPWMLGATFLGPAALAGVAGKYIGARGADALTGVNEISVSDMQKADEILRMRKATEDIHARIEAAKRNREAREKERSVRPIY